MPLAAVARSRRARLMPPPPPLRAPLRRQAAAAGEDSCRAVVHSSSSTNSSKISSLRRSALPAWRLGASTLVLPSDVAATVCFCFVFLFVVSVQAASVVAAVASPSRRAAVAAASRKRRDPLSPSTTRTHSPHWPKEINALRPRIAVAGSASQSWQRARLPPRRIPAGSARRPAHRLHASKTRPSPLFIVFFRCCCSELFLHMHPNYLFAQTDHRGRLASARARGSALPTALSLAS